MSIRLSYRRGSFRLIEKFGLEREAIVRAARLRLLGDCSEFEITGATGNRLWANADIGKAYQRLAQVPREALSL